MHDGPVVLRQFLALILVVLPSACAPISAQAPVVAPDARKADVRLTNFDTPTPIRVGQTLGVQPPTTNVEWQLDFDPEALRLLTSASDLPNPDVRGWVWRALKAGESEVTLTSRTRCREQPCAPNVMRFTVRLDIKP